MIIHLWKWILRYIRRLAHSYIRRMALIWGHFSSHFNVWCVRCEMRCNLSRFSCKKYLMLSRFRNYPRRSISEQLKIFLIKYCMSICLQVTEIRNHLSLNSMAGGPCWPGAELNVCCAGCWNTTSVSGGDDIPTLNPTGAGFGWSGLNISVRARTRM